LKQEPTEGREALDLLRRIAEALERAHPEPKPFEPYPIPEFKRVQPEMDYWKSKEMREMLDKMPMAKEKK